jgi:hypothetical protein
MKTIILFTAFLFTSLSVVPQKYSGYRFELQNDYLNNKYCTGLFKSADGTILDLSDEPAKYGYLNILDWLQGRVAGLQIMTYKNGVRVPVIRGSVAQIFVDEMRVDPFFMTAFNVNDVAMIKVIKQPFAGNFGMSIGAIAIYTYRGDEDE